MPRKSRRSRRPRRRRRMVRRRPRIGKSLFGNSRVVKLKWVTLGQIPTLLGVPGSLAVRCGGAGAPFAGGGQPRGWIS